MPLSRTLAEFIEKRSDLCTIGDGVSELNTWVPEVIAILKKNPVELLAIIEGISIEGPFTNNHLFVELVIKMKAFKQEMSLDVLYNAHLIDLVKACVWSWHDLVRVMQSHSHPDRVLTSILEAVSNSGECVTRLHGDSDNFDVISCYISSQLHREGYEFPEVFSEKFADLIPVSFVRRP